MIEMLKRLSPVPIEFIYPNLRCFGEYKHGIDADPFINKRIEIDKTLKLHASVAILAHEIAHALHDAKNCECMKNPDCAEREIHAHEDSLSFLLEHRQKKALKWLIKGITKHVIEKSYNRYAKPAAEHIMKTKLWQKCLNFVK